MKRLLCLFLSLLLVLPLAACAGGEGGPDADSPTQASSEGETGFFPDVPRADYQKPFHMVGFNQPGSWYYAEERTNNVLNDAIYEMNVTIEDYLGVDMTYEYVTTFVTGGEIFDTVRPSMLAGDDAYQLCILHPYYSYNAFIADNYAFDFYEFERNGYTDYSQSYWNKPVIDSLAINGRAYIALGALCEYSLNILYTNKTLMERAGMEMPYDKVRNGTWTLDDFVSMTKDLYVDQNGDGRRNKDDVYGFAGMWDINGSTFLQAADIFVARRNENQQFELCLMESDRLVEMYDKLFTWSKDESTYLWDWGSRTNTEVILPFLNGRTYVTQDPLGTQYLEADFDVGILPLPKYDAEQESYLHVNWGNNVVVPTSIRDHAMVGQVLELMAYYSGTVVQNAYYDTVLQYRVSNAPDDRDMVKLIYNTVVYDPGIAFCDGNTPLWNLVYITCFGIREGNKNIASYYKSNSKAAQKWLDNLFKEKK